MSARDVTRRVSGIDASSLADIHPGYCSGVGYSQPLASAIRAASMRLRAAVLAMAADR